LRRVASQSGLEHSRTRMDIPEQAPNGAFENSPGIDPRVEGTRDITPFPSAEGGRPPRGGREEIESSRSSTRPWKDRAILASSLRDGMSFLVGRGHRALPRPCGTDALARPYGTMQGDPTPISPRRGLPKLTCHTGRLMVVRCRTCRIQKIVPPDVIRRILAKNPRFFEHGVDRDGPGRPVCANCGDPYEILALAPEKTEVHLCERCGEPIPWARQEALPDVSLCVDCAASEERKSPRDLNRKCPRCGAPLIWRHTKRTDKTRYFIGCSAFPSCRHSE
jgi:predicted RNA-binding Zn-ribbon protein involved in translation (DUF1610 family)